MPPSIETQRTSSPENTLLEKLKSTLTARWQDFDRQLPGAKLIYPAYTNMQSSYKWLMSDLNTTFTDESLRSNTNIQWKIDTFLAQLNKNLQKEDRDKKYDATLTETNRLVSELRNQIYAQTIAETQQKAADLKQDVVASAPKSTPESKPETLPTTAQAAATVAAVGGTGAVAAIESGGKKAEEAVKGIMKPLEKIKKWSSDIGSAWDAGWELVKKGDISKGIWLFFAVLFGGDLKDALAKYAGKKDEDNGVGNTPSNKPADKPQESSELLTNEEYRLTATFLLRWVDNNTYSNFLNAAWSGLRDATVDSKKEEIKQNIENQAVTMMIMTPIAQIPYQQILTYKPADLLRIANVSSKDQKELKIQEAAAGLIIKMLEKNKLTIAEAFSHETNWDTQSIKHLLARLYTEKWYKFVSHMKDRIEKLSISNIAEIPKDLFLQVTMKDGKMEIADGSILKERYKAFQQMWLNPQLLKILSIDNNTSNMSGEQFMNYTKNLSENEKNFVRSMMDEKSFWWPLRNSIQHQFSYPPAIMESMRFSDLKMGDILDIYTITWWNPNLATLSIGEKQLLAVKLFGYFAFKKPAEFADYIASVSKYPRAMEAWSMISSSINTQTHKAVLVAVRAANTWLDWILWTFGIDTLSEKLAWAGGMWAILWMSFKLLPIGRAIAIATMILTALFGISLATAQQSTSKWKDAK